MGHFFSSNSKKTQKKESGKSNITEKVKLSALLHLLVTFSHKFFIDFKDRAILDLKLIKDRLKNYRKKVTVQGISLLMNSMIECRSHM